MAMITGSVGAGGLNKATDVRVIQHLLNRKLHLIKPVAALVEDGKVGQLTIGAITEFQRRVVMLSNPDGRVDTGGRTLIELNRTPVLDTPVPPPPKVKLPDGSEPVLVEYGVKVEGADRIVSNYSIEVIKMVLRKAGMLRAVITSTLRTPPKQAEIMHTYSKANLAQQKRLYGSAGNEVLKVFEEHHGKKPEAEVRRLMEAKIVELQKAGLIISRHICTTAEFSRRNVFDIGVNSTQYVSGPEFDVGRMTAACKDLEKEGYITRFIDETHLVNTCWHIEIRPGQKTLPVADAASG